MKTEQKPKETKDCRQAPPSLWHQLTRQQQEQIAVIMLRILRQWQQVQEVRHE
jgi:hypothetical protein